MADQAKNDVPLAADFPAPTEVQWLSLVDTALKGRPFETLVARTYDNLPIAPLYKRKMDALLVPGRAPSAGWQVLQRVEHPNPKAANTEALHDLVGGATGLSLVFAGAVGAYGFGLPPTSDAIEQALEGVYLDGAALEIDPGPGAGEIALSLAKLVSSRGIAPQDTDIRFGIDPLGMAARDGGLPAAWESTAREFASAVRDLSKQGFRGPFACADGRVVHAAGGSEAQELAFVLAVAVAYLRALEAHGVGLELARTMLHMRLVADADQLLTTAKFRAIRKLWARVEQACGLAYAPLWVSAETAWRMMTKRDPHVNMLRATVATFAAAVGGANAITALPFTSAIGLPDRFARRVARNTQLILAEESHLAKVSDPASGAGAIETLTDTLCLAAWTLFQEIEAQGGAAAALAREEFQKKVARVRAERENNVAHRRDALTGTSEFPLLAETPVAVHATPIAAAKPALAETFSALAPRRIAEPFEALRDASDAILAETGERPRIFLATLGKPSDFLARATFAKNFFEAGGIEAVETSGEAPLAEAFVSSGARFACICSSDAVYAAEAVATAETLKGAGARHIYLAGRPRDIETALRRADVKSFVYAGCNALETLQAAHDMLQTMANND